jgi:protein TonB
VDLPDDAEGAEPGGSEAPEGAFLALLRPGKPRAPKEPPGPQASAPAPHVEREGPDRPGDPAEEEPDPIAVIAEKIRRVAPLCYPTQAARLNLHGAVLVRFKMSKGGYVEEYQVLQSSGHALLDLEVEEVLHLAEPYPYVPGWIAVPVGF